MESEREAKTAQRSYTCRCEGGPLPDVDHCNRCRPQHTPLLRRAEAMKAEGARVIGVAPDTIIALVKACNEHPAMKEREAAQLAALEAIQEENAQLFNALRSADSALKMFLMSGDIPGPAFTVAHAQDAARDAVATIRAAISAAEDIS